MLAIYPGSFDPMTYGHLDIIKRAAKFCDKLVVAVLNNSVKQPFFSVEEKKEILREAVFDLKNVAVDSFSGLLVDYAKAMGSRIVIRGLRAVTDFEYEFQLALTNRLLAGDLETLFISTSVEYLYLSSSVVKEIAINGGDIEKMVPGNVRRRILDKLESGQGGL